MPHFRIYRVRTRRVVDQASCEVEADDAKAALVGIGLGDDAYEWVELEVDVLGDTITVEPSEETDHDR